MRTLQTDYPTLFDLHPEGTEPPLAQRVITPGCLLPIAPRQAIDSQRAASILGVSERYVQKLIQHGDLQAYKLAEGTHFRWNIFYDSVVSFCDHLRIQYGIRDTRPKLKAGQRWRDADLLPFPLADTIDIGQAASGLNCRKLVVMHLIEEGRFDAYRLLPPHGVWRISKSSLYKYADTLKDRLAASSSRASTSQPHPISER